jgi:hypothetical protein
MTTLIEGLGPIGVQQGKYPPPTSLSQPCVCGGSIVVARIDPILVAAAVEFHNDSHRHLYWRYRHWQDDDDRDMSFDLERAVHELAEDPEFIEWMRAEHGPGRPLLY